MTFAIFVTREVSYTTSYSRKTKEMFHLEGLQIKTRFRLPQNPIFLESPSGEVCGPSQAIFSDIFFPYRGSGELSLSNKAQSILVSRLRNQKIYLPLR
jgi:hypothetical protein